MLKRWSQGKPLWCFMRFTAGLKSKPKSPAGEIFEGLRCKHDLPYFKCDECDIVPSNTLPNSTGESDNENRDGFDVSGNLYHNGKLVDHKRGPSNTTTNRGFLGACQCHVGLGISCPVHDRRFASSPSRARQ